MDRFEIAVPVAPARACPRAGRAGPIGVDEGFSWTLWYKEKASYDLEVRHATRRSNGHGTSWLL
jgi:hypothetical protein